MSGIIDDPGHEIKRDDSGCDRQSDTGAADENKNGNQQRTVILFFSTGRDPFGMLALLILDIDFFDPLFDASFGLRNFDRLDRSIGTGNRKNFRIPLMP